MPQPHETLFFLTGGTGPRPTHEAFLAAAAKRTAKTREVRREREKRKEEMGEKQVQKKQALTEVGGMGTGIMWLLGLNRVGQTEVRKGGVVEGGHVDRGGGASGGGDAKKDADGASKEESAKDAGGSKEPEKEATENDTIQTSVYDAGIPFHDETRAGAQHRTPHMNCGNAGNNSHSSIVENSHAQDGER
ncbi:hypothetical protein VE03_06759 [Pseudogymnoascus sp. 23342-1-I1]|nr:hypothetical protein VE03_06759 [Pseudogymnoascus sp. 23342-1-I1]